MTVGITATTTIFSVLSSLLLRPLPVADSTHVLRITGIDSSGQDITFSLPNALDVKREMASAGALAFYQRSVAILAEGDRPVMVQVVNADSDLFAVMGLRMANGSAFRPDANLPGHSCEVAISWPLWKSHFGGVNVAGTTVQINEQPCVIDGVLPYNLDLPVSADVWTPLHFDLQAHENRRSLQFLYGLAHLKTGVSVSAFNAQLAAVCSELRREHPEEDSEFKMRALPLRDWVNQGVKKSIYILFAAVVGVLLMACANVGNLLLARSSTRLREVSVRIAVGANRAMLFQQLLSESMLLALAASLAGLALTILAVHLLKAMPNFPIPRPESIVVDWRVMLFSIIAAGITGLLFGCLPALRVSMTSLAGVLSQAGGRISETPSQQIIRRLLIAAETCIATVLLIGSLLLIHSFQAVEHVYAGFQTDHVLTAYVSLPKARYGSDTMDTVRFAESVIARLKNMPGIQSATVANGVPLQNTVPNGPVQVEGRPRPVHAANPPNVLNNGVTPEFRRTLKVPLLDGRDFDERDDRDGTTTVLANQTFAKLFFPGESAVGRRVRYSPAVNPTDPPHEIVGVIGDIRQEGLEMPVKPELFMPLSHSIVPFPAIIIRTVDNPLSHLRDIENAVHQTDAGVPAFLPRTMEQVAARRLGPRTFDTALLSGFAFSALLLASGGIFAVIAYSVSQRSSEIGIRVACGASQGDIIRMIIRQGLLPALSGIGFGVFLALLLNRFIESLLFGVTVTDLTSYVGATALLIVFATAAALIPARRAARIDPWRALRYE